MLVATLLASDPVITAPLLTRATDALVDVMKSSHLAPGLAAEIVFAAGPAQVARQQLLQALGDAPVDVIVQPHSARERKLLLADMDSTMITVECIDELADFVGKKEQVSAVTEAAMRGELDFIAALDARVALLAGLPESSLQRCYDDRVRFSPGAETLIRTLSAKGCHCVLVSGGFTFFTSRVAAQLGFHEHRGNVLEVADGRLTGKVLRPIVDSSVKRATLEAECTRLGLDPSQTIAIGDGANDIPMIEAAGLGVAYRAKPRTETAADASLRHAPLSSLLWAMGIGSKDWLNP